MLDSVCGEIFILGLNELSVVKCPSLDHNGSPREIHRMIRPKRHFITLSKSAVGNPYENNSRLTLDQKIEGFDYLLWHTWHGNESMPEIVRQWFRARVDEYHSGRRIELVCDCAVLNDFDKSSNKIRNRLCHGYSLRNYILFLAGEGLP